MDNYMVFKVDIIGLIELIDIILFDVFCGLQIYENYVMFLEVSIIGIILDYQFIFNDLSYIGFFFDVIK